MTTTRIREYGNVRMEHFYTTNCFLNGEYRDIEHFDTLESAAARAAVASRAPMIVSVHSSVENNPIETWVKGSRFKRYQNALEYAGVRTS